MNLLKMVISQNWNVGKSAGEFRQPPAVPGFEHAQITDKGE
jgi:hypothetical protein